MYKREEKTIEEKMGRTIKQMEDVADKGNRLDIKLAEANS